CANERARGSMRQLALQYLVQLTLVAIPYYADDGETLDALARAGETAWRADNETRIDTRPPVLAWLPLYAVTGQWHEVHRVLDEVRGTDSSYQAITLTAHGPVARARGEVADAWHAVQAIIPNGPETEPGDTIYTAAVAMQRLAVSLCLDAGDHTHAHAWLAAHDRWLAWSGGVQGQAEGDVLWARYYRDADAVDRAMIHAARALESAGAPRQPLPLLAAHRLLGELARAQGQYDAAHAHLDAALALADACRSPYERARTLLAMAERCLAIHERGEAHAYLAEADTIFASLGAVLDRPRAEAIKAQLSGTKPMKRTYPAGLTAREVEVLRLIAAGLSNPEAAAQLSISPRTVGQHLRAIYDKFGVSSRAAASRIAAEYGLTETHRDN
ncbi:MAG TPA: LuxR C-terminal-related transcriptional regulator, partial [Thermomicrobiales bacterium]